MLPPNACDLTGWQRLNLLPEDGNLIGDFNIIDKSCNDLSIVLKLSIKFPSSGSKPSTVILWGLDYDLGTEFGVTSYFITSYAI